MPLKLPLQWFNASITYHTWVRENKTMSLTATSTKGLICKLGMGGRSSVTGLTITVFGCSGFIAKYLVNRLGRCGNQVVLPVRGNEKNWRDLRLMGDLGKLTFLPIDFKDEETIRNAVKCSDVVFNLIGRDYNTL